MKEFILDVCRLNRKSVISSFDYCKKLETNIITPKVPGECILDFPQVLESRVVEMQKETMIKLK